MNELVTHLRPRLANILHDVDQAVDEHRDLIEQVAPVHRAGAENLVRYVALRSHDAARLQSGLSELGATRLNHPEPAVRERLQAAYNVLDAYDGQPLTYPLETITGAYAAADDILDANSVALLGEATEDTHARIMVTLPSEAADDYELVLGFARAGMELARINCAHDNADAWARMVEHVHRAGREVGRTILISCDLAGPKVRTGAIVPGPAVVRARVTRRPSGELVAPATLLLHSGPLSDDVLAAAAPAGAARPVIPLIVDPAWLAALRVGDAIRFPEIRGRARSYTVTDLNPDGSAVVRGNKNAYIAADTVLSRPSEVGGPEPSTTRVAGISPLEQRLRLAAGDTVILTTSQEPAVINDAGPTTIGCTAPEAVAALEVGHNVLFDDGTIAATVVATREVPAPEFATAPVQADGHDGVYDSVDEDAAAPAPAVIEAVLEVTRAGIGGTNLAAYKGINLPDTDIPLPSLTDEDLAAFRFVALNADIAAISFIRTPEDVEFVLSSLEQIARENPDDAERILNLGIVLKIETVPAYEQLGSILLTGMRHPKFGIMIARGDLAVELGFERMVQVPGRIMKVAEAAHIPVIMATQVLETLAKTGLPSRAEITDAGYALRAECVMLNKGPHITEAIEILDRMSRKLGRSRLKNRQMLRRIHSWDRDLT